ncbi:MAG: fibronectin type III domain-containing protein, partial [Longimicrobiales bacterium]
MLKTHRLALAALATLMFAACDDPTDPGLGVPAGVQVQTLTPSSVGVTFTAARNATGYIVERASGTAGPFAQVGAPTTTTFDDTGLLPGTQYRYRVAATRATETSAFSSEAAVTTLQPFSATISSDITTSRTLFADSTYTLSGFIHVANGATLTIQPGTRILGNADVLGSSLFIRRGARIIAKGTPQAPIVFTSSRPAGQRQPGDWGGLIIIGNARSSRSGQIILEGTGPTTGGAEIYSGGTNDADNSGELEYVRIEFAGFATGTNQELNSLTLA